MKTINRNNKIYYIYIFLSILCPLVMGVYYLIGIACLEAIMSEAISAIIAIVLGILAISEYDRPRKPIIPWISIGFWLSWLPVLPVMMISKWGFQVWLQAKLIAFITMEAFAIILVIISIQMLVRLKLKRKS